MAYFLLRLISPRATFPFDITEAERELMAKHSEYWKIFVEKGAAIAVGPVMDPEGAWGMAILDVENESAAQTLAENDPVIKGNAGFRTRVMAMPSILLQKAGG
jgi:uncharacterized protein YciI